MTNNDVMSRAEIILWLKKIQLTAKFGEKLVSISDIARMSCIHRDTLYEAINGRMSEATQRRLSLIVARLEADLKGKSLTKLGHIAIVNNQIKLGFGISSSPILRKS